MGFLHLFVNYIYILQTKQKHWFLKSRVRRLLDCLSISNVFCYFSGRLGYVQGRRREVGRTWHLQVRSFPSQPSSKNKDHLTLNLSQSQKDFIVIISMQVATESKFTPLILLLWLYLAKAPQPLESESPVCVKRLNYLNSSNCSTNPVRPKIPKKESTCFLVPWLLLCFSSIAKQSVSTKCI